MELIKTEEKKMELQPVSKQMCDDFLFTQGTKLNEQQKTMFYNLAVQFNLNPFKREIHAIPYGQGWNYVTGYQVYVSRAEATGLLNGWHVESTGNEKGDLTGAKITIYRKDWEQPFIWEVAFQEYNKNQGLWKTSPEFMIKKIAIGQGFRLAFPNELGGMPYLKEELEDITPQTHQPIQPPQKKAEAQTGNEKVIEGIITKVDETSGVKKDKTKWTRFAIHINNMILSTFSKTDGEKAQIAQENGTPVRLTYTQEGKYFTCTGIVELAEDTTPYQESLEETKNA